MSRRYRILTNDQRILAEIHGELERLNGQLADQAEELRGLRADVQALQPKLADREPVPVTYLDQEEPELVPDGPEPKPVEDPVNLEEPATPGGEPARCAVVTTRGKVCGQPLPCRYHSGGDSQ